MPISQAPQYNDTFKDAEFVEKQYVCRVPPELAFEEVLKPSFWTHVGHKLRPGDEIKVLPTDFSYIARLTVVEAGSLFAKVALESKVALEVKSDDANSLTVEFVGGKHRVRRGPDVMKDGFATKKDALRWIEDYAGQKAA